MRTLKTIASLLVAVGLMAVASCGFGGDAVPTPADPGWPADEVDFTERSTHTLDADGAQVGLGAYELIRAFGGPDAIETPDLYPINHPGAPHIYEDTDATVGDHFVFLIHRDDDIDRDRVDITDRQRNEIKIYSGSEEALKGFKDETFVYQWRFKIDADMAVSRRFSHFFQLKAVGGSDSQPMLTITGAERDGEDGIEVRHSPRKEDTILQREDWSKVTGEWLEAYVRVTFSEVGALRLIVKRMSDNDVIFDIESSNLDLWRGEDSQHFVRPKWGIYRSLLDGDNLRRDEETVRFANFSISEVTIAG